ncbi:MAG: serine/threonine protein kinase [Acidobacteria bacterium]|nr:serine/threonine protein kinase [Acidobacteriota bacterium]
MLASLNHPHIAAIYGFDESDGTQFLVLELVEGETLADRIKRGPIPVDETIVIGRQIAEALAEAHEKGVIHRDLKPANIALSGHDQVKVLDFGLAKLTASAAGASSSVSMSPTLTTPAMMTGVGMILGTAAYMAPEQVKGREADKRCDVWAFGCVVYEMLTAKRAFEGEDITDTIASIMRGEPDWGALPAGTPANLRLLLESSLTKDRNQRASDVAVLRFLLRDHPGTSSAPPTTHSLVERPAWYRVLPWIVAAAFAVALTSAVLIWSPWRAAPSVPLRKLLASIGADASLPINLGASAVLSPDGTTFAFAAEQGNQSRLFVRRLDQLQAAAIADTEGAAHPFFSPDGQWIGFFAGGRLKKVSVTGGAAIVLCDVAAGRGGTWTADDTIIFSPTGAPGATLLRVSASGGTPAVFGVLSAGATTQRWPQALPDGKGVLFTEHSSTGAFNRANLVVASMTGGAPKVVVRGGYYGRYLPSGHLVYMQQGTLFAVRFDLARLETAGTPVPALDAVAASPERGGAQIAFSSDGTLVYLPGVTMNFTSPIDWMTGDGKTSVLRSAKSDWANPRFSPDGSRLALDLSDGNHRNIWVHDLGRETLTQLTFGQGQDIRPVWTPDGRHIVFASDRAQPGTLNIYSMNADGTGDVTRLTDSTESEVPFSWHPSGRFLAFDVRRVATLFDLMILPMEGDAARGWTAGKSTMFLGTVASESTPMFSPDGRWIAYAVAEVGVGNGADVYVRPFPGPGGPWRVSTEGGGFPHWSAATHELLFVDPAQNTVMAASYTVVGDSFRVDKPHRWSPTGIRAGTGAYQYDLHPDGKRLAVAPADQRIAVQDKVVFVFNFFDYLRKIAPVRN